MWMTSVPAPSTSAPILLRTRPSSSTSGSRAQLTSVVRPLASAAAIMRFSVPVTVGHVEEDLVAAQAPAASRPLGDDVAALEADACSPSPRGPSGAGRSGRAPIWQPPGSDTFARPEARDERAEHEDAGAHLLHELVGGLGPHACRRRPTSTSGAATFTSRPRKRRSAAVVVDVAQRGDVAQAARAVGEERGAEDGERGVLRAADADRAAERPPARMRMASMPPLLA